MTAPLIPMFPTVFVCIHPGCGHIVSAPSPVAGADTFLDHLRSHRSDAPPVGRSQPLR